MGLSRQYHAALGNMRKWISQLKPGDRMATHEGDVYMIVDIDSKNVKLQSMATSPVGTIAGAMMSRDDFCKWSLMTKAQRMCRNCQRGRSEHLHKEKCLFGATSWD